MVSQSIEPVLGLKGLTAAKMLFVSRTGVVISGLDRSTSSHDFAIRDYASRERDCNRRPNLEKQNDRRGVNPQRILSVSFN